MMTYGRSSPYFMLYMPFIEMKEKYNNEIALEKERISTARAIGVAFGNNQKETTTNLMWLK